MPQGMSPNAAGGPSGSANGGNNAHGGGVYHQQQQPGGGFVPMFQPGGGPPGAAGGSPYGVQVMMLPQGGMYAASQSNLARRPYFRTERQKADRRICRHPSSARLPGPARSAAAAPDGRPSLRRRAGERRSGRRRRRADGLLPNAAGPGRSPGAAADAEPAEYVDLFSISSFPVGKD